MLWKCPSYEGVRAQHEGMFSGFQQARRSVLGGSGAPLGAASGHFRAFLSQDHMSLARLIFSILTSFAGLGPGGGRV